MPLSPCERGRSDVNTHRGPAEVARPRLWCRSDRCGCVRVFCSPVAVLLLRRESGDAARPRRWAGQRDLGQRPPKHADERPRHYGRALCITDKAVSSHRDGPKVSRDQGVDEDPSGFALLPVAQVNEARQFHQCGCFVTHSPFEPLTHLTHSPPWPLFTVGLALPACGVFAPMGFRTPQHDASRPTPPRALTRRPPHCPQTGASSPEPTLSP